MATDSSLGNNIVGIDLGTQSVRVTTWPQKTVHVLPACVARAPQSEALWPVYIAGDAAYQEAIMRPTQTAWAISRLFACAVDDAVATYEADRLPTPQSASPRGDAWVTLGDRTLSPEEAMSHVLRAAKAWAQAQGSQPVMGAVITVPHSFTSAQRRALTAAARMAGLQIQEMITAPVAAALAAMPYEEPLAPEAPEPPEQIGAEANPPDEAHAAPSQANDGAAEATAPPSERAPQTEQQCVLVVDFGAGTLDAAVMRVSQDAIEVIAEACDPVLGGDDCDEALVQSLCTPFHAAHGIDLRHMPTAHERLRQAARNVREKLSVEQSATLVLPHIAATPQGTLSLTRTVTRDDIVGCSEEHLGRAKAVIDQVLTDAQVASDNLDAIWSLGGMGPTPAWQALLAQVHPHVVACADTALAHGALRRAAMRAGEAEGPTISTPHQVRALPATASQVRGLTRDEVEVIIARDNAILAEVARQEAHKTLQARARALLANLAQSAEAASIQTALPQNDAQDDVMEQTPALFTTMAAVQQALEQDITSATAHEHLAHHLQNLDVAAAQWQRGHGHA
jgi:molecular chaperone DnaK